MLILGLILVSIGIIGIVIIIDLKKQKDIKEKLDRWCEHNKEVRFEPTIRKPVHFRLQKSYSRYFVMDCPKEILRKIVKEDFGKALMDRLEEYMVVTNDCCDGSGDHIVSIDIWVSKEE